MIQNMGCIICHPIGQVYSSNNTTQCMKCIFFTILDVAWQTWKINIVNKHDVVLVCYKEQKKATYDVGGGQ
jgi:hypothetical protein